jgi:hypothetical protein
MKYVPGGLQSAGEAIDYERLEPRDIHDLAEYFDQSLPLSAKDAEFWNQIHGRNRRAQPPQADSTLQDELSLLVILKGRLLDRKALDRKAIDKLLAQVEIASRR